MTSALAAVILAHDDPGQVRRLIAALDGVDIFLHCDKTAPDNFVREMLADAGPRVQLVPRRKTRRASWSLVEAELAGLQLALGRSAADHLIVMSGSCYPLVTIPELEDELSHWHGLSRLELNRLPYPAWDSPRNSDGGLWRFRRRFVTARSQIVCVGGIPLRTFRRSIPPHLRLYASSQWKIYARSHAATLLRIIGERTALRRFWRTSLVPEESCAASILQSPEMVGSIVDEIHNDLPWYIDWGNVALPHHPAWLGERHFAALQAVRCARPRNPDANVGDASDHETYRKLFARKVSSRAKQLLDRIDEELRR